MERERVFVIKAGKPYGEASESLARVHIGDKSEILRVFGFYAFLSGSRTTFVDF